jgi:hypothetical protein
VRLVRSQQSLGFRTGGKQEWLQKGAKRIRRNIYGSEAWRENCTGGSRPTCYFDESLVVVSQELV